MNCEPLKKHIIDTVKEWQMKIGYRAESMKLYYPAASLAELLELPEDADKDQLNTALLIFAKEEESSLGDLTFSEKDGRWNLTVPPGSMRISRTHLFLRISSRPSRRREIRLPRCGPASTAMPCRSIRCRRRIMSMTVWAGYFSTRAERRTSMSTAWNPTISV